MIIEKFDAVDASEVFFEILSNKGFCGAETDLVHEAVDKCLPDKYFPDIYIETDLILGGMTGAAVAFDAFDRHRIAYEGSDAAGVLNVLPMPANIDDVTGFIIKNGKTNRFFFGDKPANAYELEKESFLTERGCAGMLTPEIRRLTDTVAGLPGHVFTIAAEQETQLIYVPTGERDNKSFLSNKRFAQKISRLIQEGALPEKAGEILALRGLYHVPYLYNGKFGNGILKITLGYLRFILRGGKIAGMYAGVKGTTKTAENFDRPLKPYCTFQWHITDMCDQRCKHCYLFGQDPAIACYSTPYDELLSTLEKLEIASEKLGAIPLPVLTGGDPILHPRFWDFAEELNRRGYAWEILGNPFHLTDEVCERLYDLGCIRYQLSLDGREPFHDHLRKPGSYRATLAAVPILKRSGVKPTFMATASRENLDDILAAMDIAIEVDAYLFGFARYCATSPEKAKELYPTAEEYHEFLLKYYKKREEYEKRGCHTRFALKDHLFTLIEWELGRFSPNPRGEGGPRICDGCHLGQGVCILPNGDLMACRRMESVVGNARTDDVYDVMFGDKNRAYAAIADIKKCRDCELLEYCRGCRAVGYNATGDLQGEDPMCWYEPRKK